MSDQPIWYGDIDNIRKLFNVTYENGIKFERERIIALLEPFTEHIESCYIDGKLECYPDDCSCYDYEHAIRIIRGEQK